LNSIFAFYFEVTCSSRRALVEIVEVVQLVGRLDQHTLTPPDWQQFILLDQFFHQIFLKEAYWALMKIASQHGGAFLWRLDSSEQCAEVT
jgi:hypothetical protein